MTYRDADTLRELYVDEGLSMCEIAERFGVAYSTIHYWMDKHDIDRRSDMDRMPDSAGYKDPDTLQELYVGEGLSMAQLAERFGVTYSTIQHWMEKHGIDRWGKSGRKPEPPGYKDPAVLQELYLDNDLSTYEIADAFGVSQSTILYWMDRHDIDRQGMCHHADGDTAGVRRQ